MNVRILPIALITLALLACNDGTTNVITEKPDPDSSGVSSSRLVTSSSSMGGSSATSSSAIGTLISSGQSSTGSYSSPVNNTDTVNLSNLGTVRVSIIDGTKDIPSTKSTVSFSGETGNSLKINFVANDTNADGNEWEGGQTVVKVEYIVNKPRSLRSIDGLYFKSIYMDSVRHYDTTSFSSYYYDVNKMKTVDTVIQQIRDRSTLPDSRYFGFIYTSSTGGTYDSRYGSELSATETPVHDGYKPSLFNADKDGWIYNEMIPYRVGSKLCTETSCELTKVVFYFWTYSGKGSIIINGLSLLTK